MLKILNSKRGLSLHRKQLLLNCGARVELDGFDEKERIVCEVYAHIGPLKPGQVHKVASDILKMLLVERDQGGDGWHKVYCFADKAAAQQLSGDSWLARAAKRFGVEVEVVQPPKQTRASVKKAQRRQTR
ncbi:MAG: hypothetical protein ABSH14_02775 [Verrucomicrobiia bacterium]|jgi:hypothetical protein